VVARGQGADCRRVVCRRSERLGGGAAVWAAAAAGLCLGRLARGGALALPAAEALGFVPVVAAESEPAPSVTSASMPAGMVEIEIAEAVIRAAPGVDWRHLREVLRAVKAAR
jgi:hypothetical protein